MVDSENRTCNRTLGKESPSSARLEPKNDNLSPEGWKGDLEKKTSSSDRLNPSTTDNDNFSPAGWKQDPS